MLYIWREHWLSSLISFIPDEDMLSQPLPREEFFTLDIVPILTQVSWEIWILMDIGVEPEDVTKRIINLQRRLDQLKVVYFGFN